MKKFLAEEMGIVFTWRIFKSQLEVKNEELRKKSDDKRKTVNSNEFEI